MRLSEMSLDAMQSDLSQRVPTERMDCQRHLQLMRQQAAQGRQVGNCSTREIVNEPGEGLSGLGDLVFVVT